MTDAALPDGTYDAFIVDATAIGENTMHLELTITSGEFKGEVLGISATGLAGEDYELLGMPATLTVAAGVPTVTVDS